MRHVRQMTYEELNQKTKEVYKEWASMPEWDDVIKRQQLWDLYYALDKECRVRAESIGVSNTAKEYDLVM